MTSTALTALATVAGVFTAIVAVIGLVVTSALNIWKSRDETREARLRHFAQTCDTAVGTQPIPVRAASLQGMARYLDDRSFAAMTRRVLVNTLLFEPFPYLRDQAMQLLIDHRSSLRTTLDELIALNRRTWEMMASIATYGKRDQLPVDYRQLRSAMQVTIDGIGKILKRMPTDGVDLSCTRLDGADLQGVRLRNANLRGATLSYANLKDAQLVGCTLDMAVLYGAYLEEAKLIGTSIRRAVLLHGRFGNTRLTIGPEGVQSSYFCGLDGLVVDDQGAWSDIEAGARGRTGEGIVCSVRELDWQGVWVGDGGGEMTGAWESDLGSQAVTATIALDAPGRRLLRRRSSDGNDGEYRIQQGLAFEAFDRCTLVGGIQKLHGSIPRPWHCLAWNWPLTDGH